MADFKAGDRVKVEFEGTVTHSDTAADDRIRVQTNGGGHSWVGKTLVTLIAPQLPTKIGTVIDLRGGYCKRWVLTAEGWHYVQDAARINYTATGLQQWMRDCKVTGFTVVLEG